MFLPVSYVIEYRKGNTGKTRKQKITYGCGLGKTSTGRKWSYHLMVYLRLGWLTVLSSRNMVEQELYFLLTGPEWCWSGDTKVKVCLRHSIFVFLDQSKCAITTMEVFKIQFRSDGIVDVQLCNGTKLSVYMSTWAHMSHTSHCHPKNGDVTAQWMLDIILDFFFFTLLSEMCVNLQKQIRDSNHLRV